MKLISCLLFIASIISDSYAQAKSAQLDVYKIDYGFYSKATDTSIISEVPMQVQQERMEKARWKPLSVYAHSDYLYAEDVSISNEKTIWQINYKTKDLMQLQGKMALPMNFDGFLNGRIFFPHEAITDSTHAFGILTLTDDTMTVAGYRCKRAVIQFTEQAWDEGDTKAEITVWYCPQLPKFYLPGYEYLQKIPGAALLVANDRGYGEAKGIIAKAVVKQKKPVSFFKLPKGTIILYPPKN